MGPYMKKHDRSKFSTAQLLRILVDSDRVEREFQRPRGPRLRPSRLASALEVTTKDASIRRCYPLALALCPARLP